MVFSALVLGACVGLGVALAGARTNRPVVIVHGPPPQTSATSAVFVLRRATGRIACRLDRERFRRCRASVAYSGLLPGRHTFTVRTRTRKGVSFAHWVWTVLAPPPPPGPFTKLVFADDFDGTTLNTHDWDLYNSVGNGGHGLRRPSALTLDGHGDLVVTAAMAGGQLVSGGMANRQNYRYGRFEFRVRTDPDPSGTMSGVVLTWPGSGRWPIDGENDIYETGAAINSRSPFYSYVHYSAANRQYSFRQNADGAQWHTLAMEWTASAIRIYRDGALVWTVTDPAAIPQVAHHLCIQLDATADRSLQTPVRMYVDYVRIYQ
jgi:hypothetical protein